LRLQSFDKRKVTVCDGNNAAALGVLLAQPDVTAIYPITPQTSISEEISRYYAEGLMLGELVEVEGENSAMGTLVGASASGGRTFTATSSWGLVFMYDGMMMAAGQRLPIVMVNVNRETPHYMSVSVSRQDIMSVRDAGWIHVEAEDCQEILDSILFAYRLSEDPEISLPTVVSYDGFYLSHLSEKVEIPSREVVNNFLRPVAGRERTKLDCEVPMSFFTSCTTFGDLLTEYRYQHLQALQRVTKKVEEIRVDFTKYFCRDYEGALATYELDDASFVVITMGSCTGAAKTAVKNQRRKGVPVGLIRLKIFQPFPSQELNKLLQGRRCVGIIDRSVCFQDYGGHLLPAIKSLRLGKETLVLDFLMGLGSLDITPADVERAIDIMAREDLQDRRQDVFWMDLEMREK
jgi:pyruvate/2-oxoacid:ferredoxin oxidoreductase alpha subunit